MLNRFIQRFTDAIRKGASSGCVAGLVILFLILIGVPIKLQSLALFMLLFVVLVFGISLGRRLYEKGLAHLLLNSLAMGAAAAIVVFLFMSLINSWQSKGIEVKQYFDSVTTETMTVLSGVPEEELHPNPEIDPMTGDYMEGEPLRTDPMRLTFDADTGLRFKVGMASDAWLDMNMTIGGFYGFMLLLIIFGLLGTLVTWAAISFDVNRYRTQTSQYLSGNPILHWLVLLLPLILFALLWLMVGHGGSDPILNLGDGAQEIQLLTGFMLVLFGLVAMRAAHPTHWELAYPVRFGICAGAVVFLAVIGIWRILQDDRYFIAPPPTPEGSAALSVGAVVVVAAALLIQNWFALRNPERFEIQLSAVLSLGTLLLMPLYLDQYQADVMTLVGINVLLGLGLNIVVGYAGLLDLGYVAFFALGAYTYAFLGSRQFVYDNDQNPIGYKFEGNVDVVDRIMAWVLTTLIVGTIAIYFGLRYWKQRQATQAEQYIERPTLLRLPARPQANTTLLLIALAVGTSAVTAIILEVTGLYDKLFNGASPFLVGLLAGVIVSGLSGILLGIPVLRLRGDYLAIVTLGFGEIIRLMFNNLRDYTGGPQGVLQIPRPLPNDAAGPVTYLSIVYLVFMGAGLVAFLSARLKQSRTGRAWSAMNSDETIAQSMGVNLVQSKLMAFAIGAAFAGIGGVLFAARQRNIFPGDFNLEVSIEVLSLVIIGGMGSIPGVIMGAIVLIGIPEVLRELSTYRILVFGALLVTMVIIRPKGLLPAPTAQLRERARALVHGSEESQA
ncbi:MAG: hypothetical protein JW966_10980 [Anaerolineae bacterium]|nr:hypothetical protein [Anaerolineae bacterium]